MKVNTTVAGATETTSEFAKERKGHDPTIHPQRVGKTGGGVNHAKGNLVLNVQAVSGRTHA